MQPGVGVRVTSFAPVSYSIFANNEVTETVNAMLQDYDHNDWRYVVGTAGSLFPVGALLGYAAIGGGATAAMAADGLPAPVSPVQVYTYTSIAIVGTRGRLSNNNIPASVPDHACVLAKDVNLADNGVTNLDYVVPVYFRGTFKINGLIQDAESFALAPFLSNARITIMPANR